MSDAALRQLERSAAMGDPTAQARLDAARLRAGWTKARLWFVVHGARPGLHGRTAVHIRHFGVLFRGLCNRNASATAPGDQSPLSAVSCHKCLESVRRRPRAWQEPWAPHLAEFLRRGLAEFAWEPPGGPSQASPSSRGARHRGACE